MWETYIYDATVVTFLSSPLDLTVASLSVQNDISIGGFVRPLVRRSVGRLVSPSSLSKKCKTCIFRIPQLLHYVLMFGEAN